MLIKTFPRSVFQLSSTTVASGIVRRILYGWFVSWFFRSFDSRLSYGMAVRGRTTPGLRVSVW